MLTYPSIDFSSELANVHPLMKHLSFLPNLVVLVFFIVNDIFFILNRLFFFFLLGFILIAALTSIILRDVSI
jgi:hypothetical protein